MKTFDNVISFPSAAGELMVQYNFTPAEAGMECQPNEYAEVEIVDAWFKTTDNRYFLPKVLTTGDFGIKQAVYIKHMHLLRDKEDAEAQRQDGYETLPDPLTKLV